MRKFVVGFLRERSTDRVVFIRKSKPEWQAGKLNGVGGKIEPGEHPFAAMCREWTEETSTKSPFWREFAVIHGPGYQVHFFRAVCDKLGYFPRNNDVGEEILTAKWNVVYNEHVSTISNLRWLLPLAFADDYLPTVVATQER